MLWHFCLAGMFLVSFLLITPMWDLHSAGTVVFVHVYPKVPLHSRLREGILLFLTLTAQLMAKTLTRLYQRPEGNPKVMSMSKPKPGPEGPPWGRHLLYSQTLNQTCLWLCVEAWALPQSRCRVILHPIHKQLSDANGTDIAVRVLDHRLDRILSFSHYLLDADNNERDGHTFCSCEDYVLVGRRKTRGNKGEQ